MRAEREIVAYHRGPRSERRLPLAATLFLLGLVVPVVLQLGPFRLSAYRLVLLVTVLPCLAFWLAGRAGGYRLADLAVLGIWLWSALAAAVVHGAAVALEPSGILFLEGAGAYLLARCTVRTAEAFRGVALLIVGLALALLPFAFWEMLTADNPVLAAFGLAGPVHPDVAKPPRLGLDRVQGPFEHPILFGVFCGTGVGLGFYVLGHGRGSLRRGLRALPPALAAAASLSSGPILSLLAQAGLVLWERATRGLEARWGVLAALLGAAYVAIALLSSRAPVVAIASHLAFNLQTAYSRVAIWDWGTRSILAHPVFGIGFGDWERAPWMTDSVDMFWILPAMRHGLPVGLLYALLLSAAVVAAVRVRRLDARAQDYRTGWLICMAGLFLAGWTVNFWNATFALFMFLAGCGAWFAEAGAAARPDAAPLAAARPLSRRGSDSSRRAARR